MAKDLISRLIEFMEDIDGSDVSELTWLRAYELREELEAEVSRYLGNILK